MIGETCCLGIVLIIFVFALLLILISVGTQQSHSKTGRKEYEYTSDSKTYETTKPIDKTFEKLENWTMVKNYRVKREKPPSLITIKPCYFCSDLDIELSKDGKKTILTVSSSGKRAYVDKAFSKFKDFVAELSELD